MQITVLGSGTSSGVPTIGCECAVCHSNNPKNKRLRSSCFIQTDSGINLLIDTSPDLRAQALQNNIKKISAVLYTHIHADHVHGIDDLRMYNAISQSPLPIYGNAETIHHLTTHFSYVFRPPSSYPSLIPTLIPHVVEDDFQVGAEKIIPIACEHGKKYITQNYRVGNVAWLTDTSGISETSLQKLQGIEVVFLDALRFTPHPTHFSLDEALATLKKINAKKSYLIHLTHDYDHDEFNKTLPENIELAYDGLTVFTR